MKHFLLTMLLFACCAFGQSTDFASSGYASGAAEFLKLPMSARSAALCGAVAAWQDELLGAQYNPAILDAAKEGAYYLDAGYTVMTLDRKNIGAMVAGTVGAYFAWGLSFINYGVGDIEGRDSVGTPTENFSYSENAITASIAGHLKRWNISGGASFRFLFEKLYTEGANGIGFDLGAAWRPLPMLSLAVSGQNLLSKLWWSTGRADPVRPVVRIGLGSTWLNNSLSAELDLVKTVKQPEQACLGIQYSLLKMFLFRGGMAVDIDASSKHSNYPDFSFGLGMRYSFFGFDYACLIPSSDLGTTHKISIFLKILEL
jgi:hypothetical protein